MKANDKSEMLRNLLPIWDYGWVDLTKITLPPATRVRMLVQSYIASDSFGTSFVGPQLDISPDIHGAFSRAKLSVDHFLLLSPSEFIEEIELIRQPLGFQERVNDDQWEPVKKLAIDLADQHVWILKLIPNEDNTDLLHDWGWVLSIFREYFFGNPNSSVANRLVFGYD